MAADIPTAEPTVIQAGDTVKWTKSLSDYPASDGWVLTYSLRGVDDLDVTATADGSDHSVTISSTDTGNLTAGVQWLTGSVELAGEKYTVYSGQVTVLADLSQQIAGYDGRTHAKKMLDAIETLLEGKPLAGDAQSYSIAGRSISKLSYDELLRARSRYASEYAAEVAKENRAAGKGGGSAVKVRFRSPA